MAIRDYFKRYSIHGFQDAIEIYPENYEQAIERIKKEHDGEIEQIRITLFSSKIGGDSVFEADVYCLENRVRVCIGKVKNKHTSKGKGVDMIRIISQDDDSLSKLEIKLGLRGDVVS